MTESAALANHLPDDDYWAAKQILAFADDDLRVVVKAAQYTDPQAEEWVAKCLIERRDKVVRYCLDRVLPLENFRIEDGTLRFDDLAVQRGFRSAQITRFNGGGTTCDKKDHSTLERENSFRVPERALAAGSGAYYAARISADVQGKTLTVYFAERRSGVQSGRY